MGREFDPGPVPIDHEIISKATLPSADSRRVVFQPSSPNTNVHVLTGYFGKQWRSRANVAFQHVLHGLPRMIRDV